LDLVSCGVADNIGGRFWKSSEEWLQMPLSHFDAEQWSRLSSVDRSKQCRHMAEEARQLAAKADGEMRSAYVKIAQSWDHLADEIERTHSN